MTAENQDNKSEAWQPHPVPPLCNGRLGGVEACGSRANVYSPARHDNRRIRPPLAPPYEGGESPG